MTNWRPPGLEMIALGLDRVLHGGGRLLAGNAGASLITLATYALIARGLGPTDFGRFILILAVVAVLMNLTSFKTWQAFIHFGTQALQEGNAERLCRLVKFGYVVDIASALVGIAIGLVVMSLMAPWFELDAGVVATARLYCLAILVNVTGVPTGILRLFNRFGVIAAQQIGIAALRLAAIAGASVLTENGALDLHQVLTIWLLGELAATVFLLLAGARELRQQGLSGIRYTRLAGLCAENPALLPYVVTTNLHETVRLLTRDGDVVIFGILAGPAPAGLFRLMKQLSGILLRFVDPFSQALYPELARLVANRQGKDMTKLSWHFAIIVAGVSVCLMALFLTIGNSIVFNLYGAEYQSIYLPLLLHLVGTMIAAIAAPMHPMMLALGQPGRSLLALFVGTVVYVGGLFFLVEPYGLLGAAAAYLAFYTVWVMVMFIVFSKLLCPLGERM